jgi:hypothetical protein
MSSMPFDPSQALAGALGGGGAPPPPPDAGGGDPLGGASVAPPASGDASDTLKQIIDLFNIYMQEEQDPQDLAIASDLQAKTHKLLADQQKLTDQATGAGPGARLVRKATAQQGGGGGGY